MSIFSGVLQSLLGGVAGGANSVGDTLKEKEYFKRKVENDAATERRKSEAEKVKAERDLIHALITKRADQGAYPSFGDELVMGSPKSAQKTQPSFSLNTDTPISTAGSFGDALVASAPAAAPTSGPIFNPNNMVTSTSDLYDLNKLGRFMSGVKFERTPEASMKDQLLFGKYGLDHKRLDETVRHNREMEGLGNSRMTNQDIGKEANFRKEFVGNQTTKLFQGATEGISKIRETMSNPNKTGFNDQALIFHFMKALDPASVVREGEYAAATKNAGILDKLGISLNRVMSGEQLSDQQRQNLFQAAETQYRGQLNSFKTYKQNMHKIAKESGLDPSKVLPSFTKEDLIGEEGPPLEDIDAEIARRMGGR